MKTRALQLSLLMTLLSSGLTPQFVNADVRDDFNTGNDNGWTRYQPLAPVGAPGTFSFPNGGYRIQAMPSPDAISFGPGRAGSFRADQVYPNSILNVDLTSWDNNLNQSFGLMARVNGIGAGSLSGYAFTYSPAGGISISLVMNDRATVLASKAFTLDPAQPYYFD